MANILNPSSQLSDNIFRITGSSDFSKKLAFEVDGFTTATTRTLTPQDASYTIAGLETSQTFTNFNAFISGNGVSIQDTGGSVTPLTILGKTGTTQTLMEAWRDTGSVGSGPGHVFDYQGDYAAYNPSGGSWRITPANLGAHAGALGFATITANRNWVLPDLGGTFAFINAAQTITGKWTIGAGADDTICLALDSYTAGGSTNDFLTINDTASITSSGFTMTLALATAGLTTNRRVSIPDSTGQLVLTASTDNLQNKTLVPTGGIRCGTSTASGIKFQNGSSVTQFMMLDMAALTAQRNMKWPDEAGQQSSTGNQTVASGANATARAPGKVDVTTQGADFAQAQIVTSPTAGMWRIDSYLECTTAGAGSGAMTTTWGWTDDVGAQTDATQTHVLTSTTVPQSNSFSRVVYVASGHITIKCLNGGAYLLGAQYALHARATFLG